MTTKKKITCPDCGVEISINNIKNHQNSKTCMNNQKYIIGNNRPEPGICPHCNISLDEFSKANKANHVRWCEMNPKRNSYLEKLTNRIGENNPMFGKPAWNKGKTKETDDRIKKSSEVLSKKYQSGELTPKNKGVPITEETREKIRQTQLQNKYQRICKSTINYKCKDSTIIKMDSKWEVRLAEDLDEHNIDWIRPKPLKWVDSQGIEHNYFPDFYLPEFDIYLDPKNEWVRKNQEEKINYLMKHYDNIFLLYENELSFDFIKKNFLSGK